MHTYGEEFLSEIVTVIEFHYNFHCLFVLKSDKYKLMDWHRLKLINFSVLVILKKFLDGPFTFSQEQNMVRNCVALIS